MAVPFIVKCKDALEFHHQYNSLSRECKPRNGCGSGSCGVLRRLAAGRLKNAVFFVRVLGIPAANRL